MIPVLLLTLALAQEPATTSAPDVPLTVDATLEGDPSKGAKLRVRVTAPPDRPFTLDPLRLDPVQVGELATRDERIGDQVVRTLVTPLVVPPGSHALEGICASFDDAPGSPVCAETVWVDVGEAPDRQGMADIVEPSAVSRVFRWVAIAAAAGLLVLALVVVLLRRLRRPRPVAPPAPVVDEPAHVVAWRRWEALRDDATLSDHDKALGLSEIFRAYAEASLSFPARAWSTSETLTHLESLSALPRTNIPRARRLLRATDRVKYAEVAPGDHFFAELEDDLRGFIEATRPTRLPEERAP